MEEKLLGSQEKHPKAKSQLQQQKGCPAIIVSTQLNNKTLCLTVLRTKTFIPNWEAAKKDSCMWWETHSNCKRALNSVNTIMTNKKCAFKYTRSHSSKLLVSTMLFTNSFNSFQECLQCLLQYLWCSMMAMQPATDKMTSGESLYLKCDIIMTVIVCILAA